MNLDQKSPIAPAVSKLQAINCNHDDEWLELGQLLEGAEDVGGMVVQSAQMQKVLKTISRLGPYKATVLIYGESGTGKELVARALHTLGPVPKGPFVTFNCSNLVESLAESQLFGHVRGAFTDAREDSLGYFRSANGGTLFLDEIGELPIRLQPKLLRAVETHEVQPVGSAQSYKVDIRLIAATNRDLRAMVKAAEFRDDLYYRLSASAINVPPLRERRCAPASGPATCVNSPMPSRAPSCSPTTIASVLPTSPKICGPVNCPRNCLRSISSTTFPTRRRVKRKRRRKRTVPSFRSTP